jgi:hypothetical protein
MISSTSPADRSGRPENIATNTRPPMRRPQARPDEISTQGAAFLRAELARQPEVRPEVVERARALAADPDYPPASVVRHVAEQILGAPDLSEIE